MITSWGRFKEEMQTTQNEGIFLYRGHASKDWSLQTTLFRYTKKDRMLAREYHKVLLQVQNNIQKKCPTEFSNLILPNESPFKIGLLTSESDYGKHHNDFKNTFGLMILLRHLGFPTPILDWTKNYQTAVFFALANTSHDEDIAIYQINNNQTINTFGFGLKLFFSEFEFDSSIISRHVRQNSVYSVAIEQSHYDTVCSPDKRLGPQFYLDDCEHLLERESNIKKFVIENSKQNRIAMLKELYDDGLSWEQIYDKTHIMENSVLKDLAIQTLLF